MIKTIWEKFIDFILPPRCISCSKSMQQDIGVCSDCFKRIDFISAPFCKKCGMPLENTNQKNNKKILCGACIKNKNEIFRMQRFAIKYNDMSKNMILGFKFLDKTENAKIFAKWLHFAAKDIYEEGIDIIIPVPLHFKRLIKRKYNQSALLAKELSKISNIKVEYSALKRAKNNRPQVEFSGRARKQNVKNVFTISNSNKIEGKRILLVDDVYTTGSTMKECAKSLKKVGAKSVDFITIART